MYICFLLCLFSVGRLLADEGVCVVTSRSDKAVVLKVVEFTRKLHQPVSVASAARCSNESRHLARELSCLGLKILLMRLGETDLKDDIISAKSKLRAQLEGCGDERLQERGLGLIESSDLFGEGDIEGAERCVPAFIESYKSAGCVECIPPRIVQKFLADMYDLLS